MPDTLTPLAGPSDVAEQALALVAREPRRAAELARAALAAAGSRDRAAASVAERALGLAARELSDGRTALVHLRRAVVLAERAGSPQLAGQARMSLALGLAEAGRMRAALAASERAVADLDGVERARAEAQRAMLLTRTGRAEEALDGYRRAVAALRRAGDRPWLARALTNRGLQHAYGGALALAETDLLEVERLAEAEGMAQLLAATHHNLGFVAGRRGDVPLALARFDEAAEGYRGLGLPRAMMLADRGEVLLAAHLVHESRAAAEQAIVELARGGVALDLAEARLALAQAALLADDEPTARAEARLAARAFRRHDREPWALLADHVALLAAGPGATGARLDAARRLADGLDASGWRAAALDARIAAGVLALRLGRAEIASAELGRAAGARRRGPMRLRVRAWYAEALRRDAGLAPGSATTALAAGMRLLDDYRATLGATELRAQARPPGDGIAELGLRLALRDGDARRLLRWSERCRAQALRLRPVRPPGDDRLAADLAELRRATAELEEAALDGMASPALERRVTTLEHAVRQRTRHARGGAGDARGGELSLAALSSALGERALVAYLHVGGRLHAVTLVAGRARTHALGDAAGIDAEVASLRGALGRLARPGAREEARAVALAAARTAAGRLQAAVLAPLGAVLDARALVLVPTGALHGVPWTLLPGCAEREVTVAPSAAAWLRAATAAQPPTGRVALVAGPELPEAGREVAELHAAYPDAAVLTGAGATAAAALEALDGAAIAHVAAHGVFRADNPLFSSLILADGPLFAYDLERLERAPGLIVLSSCEAARTDVRPGDEVLGLGAALLGLGAATVVAPVVPVPDDRSRELVVAFHAALRRGRAPAAALAEARGALRDDDPAALAAAHGFGCFGAG